MNAHIFSLSHVTRMRSLLLLPFVIFISGYSFSQDTATAQSPAEKNAIAVYDSYIGKNSSLINGSEFSDYDPVIKGLPFFDAGKFQKGRVTYNGTFYDSIDMVYDIVQDELIILRRDDNTRIRLVKEKIDSFTCNNHLFIKLIQGTNNKPMINTGFYDLLYNGKIKLYAKRKKMIIEKIVNGENEKWFQEKDSYFVQKDESFYPIQDKSELLDFVNDRKKEVKEYIGKNKLSFKKAKEQAILSSIAFYDQLKNQK